MEPKLKPRSKRPIGLRLFASLSLVGKNKGLRRNQNGSRTQPMLPRNQEPPPPAVEASRLKLLNPEADPRARVEASRLKPSCQMAALAAEDLT